MNTTTQSSDDFHYGFCCVALLDILGQRRKLRQLPRIPSADESTKRILSETAGEVLRLRGRLESSFEEFRRETGILKTLPKEVQDRMQAAKQSVKFRYFSDLIVMEISFWGDKEQLAPMTGVYSCIGACSVLHALSLASKNPIRGGINVGPGLEIAKDEIYGLVSVDAYDLESELADYPRILVGEDLSSYLNVIESNTSPTPEGRIAKQLAAKCKRMIVTDTDGFSMLDFLGEEIIEWTPDQKARQHLLEKINVYISEQVRTAQAERNYKHLSRYFRLGAYVNQRSERWKNGRVAHPSTVPK
jgi:hypothetical protein